MSSFLNRRKALLVAGQGMAALLLAACGQDVRRADGTGNASLPAPATPASARVPAPSIADTAGGTPPPAVTVPALRTPGPATTRSLIPLHPVTTATPTSAARQPAPPTTPTPSTTPAASTTATPSTAPHSSKASTTPSTGRVDPTASSSTSSTTSRTSSTPVARTATPTASSSRLNRGGGLSGRVVAIDPGHNGGNAGAPEIINALIDGGYGQRNVCNTTGTETNAGYPEHQFTWQVAGYLRPLLEAAGITVVVTRKSDTGVGPCTNKRAQMENAADADAVVSIHGDGAAAAVRGFYVLTATRPPAGAQVAAASLRLASCIAAAAVDQGFPASNTLGHHGLWTRDDLTGLNLSMRPKILIECGNMRNAAEAAVMSSRAGQRRYAAALAEGVFAFLRAG